jgi:SAM-dependent methyltransferase
MTAAPAGYGIRADYRHGGGAAARPARRGRYWTRLRRHTHRYFQAAVYRLAREVAEREGLRSVLDAGCGPGVKLRRQLGGRVDELVGVDRPACAAFWTAPGAGTRFEAVDLEAAGPSLGRTFDLVMAVDVVEHLDDPDRLLDFLRRHMHARSLLLLSTPERDLLRGPGNRRSPNAEHVREWNRDELRRYLESRGFAVERHEIVSSYDVGRSPVMCLYRAWGLAAGAPRAHTQVVLARLAESWRGAAPPSPRA